MAHHFTTTYNLCVNTVIYTLLTILFIGIPTMYW